MPVFVDSNVLVYARDASEGTKHERAIEWLTHLWTTHSGRLSFQVLHEFYVTVTRKLDPGLTSDEARADVRSLLAWRPIGAEAHVLEGAWDVEDRFGLSFWDAMIVSAAKAAGCQRLLTEDLRDGQEIDGLQVASPFAHAPESSPP